MGIFFKLVDKWLITCKTWKKTTSSVYLTLQTNTIIIDYNNHKTKQSINVILFLQWIDVENIYGDSIETPSFDLALVFVCFNVWCLKIFNC